MPTCSECKVGQCSECKVNAVYSEYSEYSAYCLLTCSSCSGEDVAKMVHSVADSFVRSAPSPPPTSTSFSACSMASDFLTALASPSVLRAPSSTTLGYQWVSGLLIDCAINRLHLETPLVLPSYLLIGCAINRLHLETPLVLPSHLLIDCTLRHRLCSPPIY
jgi:hypothetical protein